MTTTTNLSRSARELFALEIPPSCSQLLVTFAEIVMAWSDRMNLVSAGSLEQILYRHVVDSFAPIGLLTGTEVLVDIGSGAGFPGIPLAILLPDVRVNLIESRRKRTNFLRHAVRSLELGNVRIHETRGEDWIPEVTPDVTIGRAVRFDVLASISLRLLPGSGRLVSMRKAGAPADGAPGFAPEQTIAYRLPGGEHHELVSFRKCST